MLQDFSSVSDRFVALRGKGLSTLCRQVLSVSEGILGILCASICDGVNVKRVKELMKLYFLIKTLSYV